MRKVILTMKENYKYETIKELVDHNGNKKRASLKLNLTVRQINRLIRRYKEEGKAAFVHGNHHRRPVNKLSQTTSDMILTLYKETYYDFNFNHFKDMLEKHHNIKVSYNCLYNTLVQAGYLSTKAQRKTRRKKAKEALESKSVALSIDQDIAAEINYEQPLEHSHPRQQKPKYFGEIIEMDGSIHKWFGEEKTCLHLAIDLAEGKIVGGYFAKQETLVGYYEVLKQILENYGIPLKFRTDNRTVFAYNSLNKDKRTPDKDVLTQFGYACKNLGIELETTSVSQAKGTIERANETFQGRLVSELRLNKVDTIDEANNYLINDFIPFFNKHFNRESAGNVMEISPTPEQINNTLAIITNRKIDDGNCVKYYNKYYLSYDADDNLVCLKPKTNVLVIKTFDGNLILSCGDKLYNLKELQEHKEHSDAFFEEAKQEKKKLPYIPPMSHPWKYASFMAQQRKAHQYKEYA